MKKMLNMIIVLTAVVSTAACAQKHGKKTSSIPYVEYSSEYVVEGETIDVPFSSHGGVKYVTVKVNGLTTDMIFDTGCSLTLLSMHEAQQLGGDFQFGPDRSIPRQKTRRRRSGQTA